jgi:hypothetical protein
MNRATRLFLLGVGWLAGLCGCVERELTITSQPQGAMVEISGEEVGLTPLRHKFTWYGDYRIVLRKDGYQTLKTHANLNPPLYEIPPLDLLSAMAPWTYHDQRYLHYDLETQEPLSDEELLRRAREMGDEAAKDPR